MDATAGLTVLGFPLGIMHRMHYIERIDIKDDQVHRAPIPEETSPTHSDSILEALVQLQSHGVVLVLGVDTPRQVFVL